MTTEPGEFRNLPPRCARGKAAPRVDRYGMDKYAFQAQNRPGQAVLAGTDIPERYTRSLRLRRRDPYLSRDGRIIVSTRNTHWEGDERVCDVYFTWEEFPEIPGWFPDEDDDRI